MGLGAKTKFSAPWSNLSFLGSKFTVLKKVLLIVLGLFGASRSDSTVRAYIVKEIFVAPTPY